MEANEQSNQIENTEDIDFNIEFPLPKKGDHLFKESPNLKT